MGGRQKKSASVATGKIGKEAIQAKLKQEEKLKSFPKRINAAELARRVCRRRIFASC